MQIICETERLVVRHFELKDAPFIIELLNQDAFIRYIADKQVRTLNDALRYLTQGPMLSYREQGFGLNLLLTQGSMTPIGMCGLLKRPELTCPDIGYALLSDYWGQGYGEEAARAVLAHGFSSLGLPAIQGVTLPENQRSNQLLQKLGFNLVEQISLYGKMNNLYQLERKP
ncbi:alanine acetyltransferase [Shewanella sp. NFH-SH190041]|uniref:GNAT family N-acetyltransferase n=1 Tax=Shewanella sp. NFH-SH190041 TaxID=2950245 RepID=UPI0021C437F5|nr:GNAT family N-acetyltransferase [Shewanella sp. NFH-SH190041]BDM64230.1 alanine acetyltransferase [Shewanella sp. NFH-SH190041]